MREEPPLDILLVKEQLYDKHALHFTALTFHKESAAYGACSFLLNRKNIEHRVSKITPTKTGQFVAIWKRNAEGITCPPDITDGFDFFVITSGAGDKIGQFFFPKQVLVEKGIVTANGKEGKRGIRVYPPWDAATSKQAAQTQNWQTKYFVQAGDKAGTAILEILK